jgi:uncharacterized membrane protein
MQWLGQLHPLIVHTPIALLIFSALFAVGGRLFDRDWVRKASVLLLVFGFLGAFAAVRSGDVTSDFVEQNQGVPEHAVDQHEAGAKWTLWLSGAALVALAAGAKLPGRAAQAAGALALVLQLMAAAAVSVTGYHGGQLVYEHGARVTIGGVLMHDAAGGGKAGAHAPPAGAAADSGAARRRTTGS